MKTIWIAEYESRHFTFAAYGESPEKANEAMMLLLEAHRRQYHLGSGWYNEDDITLDEVKIGAGYRDHFEVLITEIDRFNVKSKTLIGFEYNGVWIINPYEGEGGLEVPVDPSYYGFEPIHLGGNCMGLILNLGLESGGGYILITDQHTCNIPTLETKPEDIMIGKYDSDYICLGSNTLADALAYMYDQCKP